MRGEPLKGHLDSLLLAVVNDGAGHGYAIIERLRADSDGLFDLAEGTVYPALHRLERAGLLTSAWTEGPGRRRRQYELTAAGRAALITQKQEWKRFSRGVSTILEGP